MARHAAKPSPRTQTLELRAMPAPEPDNRDAWAPRIRLTGHVANKATEPWGMQSLTPEDRKAWKVR